MTIALKTGLGPAVVLMMSALLVSGCVGNRNARPAPLAPAPSAPVTTTELPPPPEPEAPIADEALPDAPAAQLPDESTAVSVGRTDLVGGWTLSSGGDTCGLFMSLTTWTGGYRASTRGCTSPLLASISAWDLTGNTVSLKGGDGASPVATLRATAPTNFQGATVDGAAISVTR